ncbi:hypothetical protein DER72_12160 [Halomonas sp. A11-A]|nr:hypothetical protein DER72_12160 [Halomonas sp. A11-A]
MNHNHGKFALPHAQAQSLKNEHADTTCDAQATDIQDTVVLPTSTPPWTSVVAHFGSLEALYRYLDRRPGLERLNDLSWIVGEVRVSQVPISPEECVRFGFDPEPIEAGWSQYRLGSVRGGPLLHLSPRGEVFIEFIDWYGLGMDATIPLYTFEQLSGMIGAQVGREVAAA